MYIICIGALAMIIGFVVTESTESWTLVYVKTIYLSF